jgi:hypothetical protein
VAGGQVEVKYPTDPELPVLQKNAHNKQGIDLNRNIHHHRYTIPASDGEAVSSCGQCMYMNIQEQHLDPLAEAGVHSPRCWLHIPATCVDNRVACAVDER